MKILLFPIKFIKYVFLGFISIPLILIDILKHFLLCFTIPFRKKQPKVYVKPDTKTNNEKTIINNNEKENTNNKHNIEAKKEQPVKTVQRKKVKQQKVIRKNVPRVPMKIDYNGPDAVKTPKKQIYEYFIKDKYGVEEIGYFAGFSKVEVHSFLLSEGATVYDIRTSSMINALHSSAQSGRRKIKNKDLIFVLAQLSTYLKSGISLVDSVEILTRQFKKSYFANTLRSILFDLSTGKNFSEALDRQGKAFPRLLINMVKASEMTGELPETLDDMEEYYTEIESTRKAMISAMMYPVIIFIIAIGVGVFIMLYVVPKFVEIYESMDDAKIPGITKFVLWLSNFLSDYVIIIGFAVIIFLLIFAYLYRHVKAFKFHMQWIAMHIPVFGNVIIYNEVTMFTKTFASLLSHNVFITDSMDILNKVTDNEIYRDMINEAVDNISTGGNISTAFKDHWAFPLPAYEMIVTGEKTGQLPEMMEKVSAYYQDLHRNSVSRLKTFIEPVLIIMLTVMVGVIVLSIVVPMFNMYGAIQQ